MILFTAVSGNAEETSINNSLVQQLDEHTFRINTITFDSSTRRISFPARIQMVEGNLEYLLVTKRGKTHESLLRTDIQPGQLNIAFKLLSYEESTELFEDKKDTPSNDKAAFDVKISWEKDNKTLSFPVTDLIRHTTLEKSMPPARWINNGSMLIDGKFNASVAGDIIAIYNDQSAMLNYSGDSRDDDTVWEPYKKRLPAPESPVTVTLEPYIKK